MIWVQPAGIQGRWGRVTISTAWLIIPTNNTTVVRLEPQPTASTQELLVFPSAPHNTSQQHTQRELALPSILPHHCSSSPYLMLSRHPETFISYKSFSPGTLLTPHSGFMKEDLCSVKKNKKNSKDC